jgi:ubiquinone/menaquinone biosynthesis C-methylase UbiE
LNKLVSGLRSSIPKPVRGFVKNLYLGALDFSDAAARRRDMTPPRSMNFVGDGDYKAVGLEFRTLFTEYGGLKPEHRVLDVGCGIGRMAVPLTGYLSADGEYQGFDIVKKGIEWCQENITSRHPNFYFSHFDIHNNDYNPHGVYQASSHKFPYENGSFDFVFLTSVFTHMFPPDMENYLNEISRVLKKGGTCFITFFLMNEESQSLIRKNLSTQNFVHEIAGCFTTTVESPEAAIAFPEPYIRGVFGKFGLFINEPIHYGSWCGRAKFLSYQDIVIARKG